MEPRYKIKQHEQAKKSALAGLVLSIGCHVVVAIFGVFTGMKYIWPPPQEQAILIEFEEVATPKPVQHRNGSQPRSENPDKTKPINLVQASQAQHEGTKANEAPESVVDDFGDVEVKQPEREKEIDRRALFHAADNKTDKDTLAQQTANKVSDALKAGHAQGNTTTGKTSGEPNAKLKGRSVNGALPKPSYPVQESGTVVVTIWVDQYGSVKKAVAGAEGTTVDNSDLWAAARKAAMEAHFNMSADAPALQEGTITYVFHLK